jgi:hypothetical protein
VVLAVLVLMALIRRAGRAEFFKIREADVTVWSSVSILHLPSVYLEDAYPAVGTGGHSEHSHSAMRAAAPACKSGSSSVRHVC